jgi:hypothetical protein
MKTRMATVGIVDADVQAAIANPQKTEPAKYGRINAWGMGANGVRIRVTYHPGSAEIRTVAIAEVRYK